MIFPSEEPSAFLSHRGSDPNILLRFKEPLVAHDAGDFTDDFDSEQVFDFAKFKQAKAKGISFFSTKNTPKSSSTQAQPIVERAHSSHKGVEFGTGIDESSKDSYPVKLHVHSPKLPDRKERRSLVEQHNYGNLYRKSLTGIDLNSATKPPKHIDLPANEVSKLRLPYVQTPLNKPRQALVKVSLTPAQKVQRASSVKLKNALEDFEFSTLVGRGAFANVYKGTNLKTKKVLAIKQIILERDQDVGDLMNEIDLLKILKHPHIVKYHGFVKTSATLNVFLEYCSGGSLRQLYKRLGHGLPETQLSSYVRMILLGLEYLHEQGVVHRDVKAANVLLSESGVIKLADFGVASKVSSQHQTVVGTPNWMAPETILGGEGLCTASDIWSLGATIIELFTTNPPYHDLNPMATLHAIGTDEHPPLPKGFTPLARDFLLECFQKQPGLRISAKLLLKHKWITGLKERKSSRLNFEAGVEHQSKSPLMPIIETSTPSNSRAITHKKPISEFKELNLEENWNDDFEGPLSDLSSKSRPTPASKNDLLKKFSDSQDDMEFGTQNLHDFIQRKLTDDNNFDDDSDPFLDIDIDDFDTKELEIQTKMEYLISKLLSKVEDSHLSKDSSSTLIKVTGRMLHMVKKYKILHQVLIQDHGILTLLELLDSMELVKGEQRLWFHTLAILNNVFLNDVAQLENFCLLGGIPLVAQFRSSSYEPAVRLQVIKFVKLLEESDKALSMFVSCGGLRVLVKFVQEDLDAAPEFSLVAIGCIHRIMTNDVSRSKSDICRMLSKYGVVFWFVVLLNGLTIGNKVVNEKDAAETVNKIMEIIKFFGQSEAKVRAAISNSELIKLIIKVYFKLELVHQLTVLKFLKSVSSVSSNLKLLQNAEILDFLVELMKQYTPSQPHYREVINIVSPLLYNCCYLNTTQETELVRLGAIPLLKGLSVINLPFRQFVLPILCELVHCNEYVRKALNKHDISKVYLNLVLDPYWQSSALEALAYWRQANPDHIHLESSHTASCLLGGISIYQISNIESSLDSYLKLLISSEGLQALLVASGFAASLQKKLTKHNKSSVVQLGLLRILKVLASTIREQGVDSGLTEELEKLSTNKTSVLVSELAREILHQWHAL